MQERGFSHENTKFSRALSFLNICLNRFVRVLTFKVDVCDIKVRERGFEPPQALSYEGLNLARLTAPALPHNFHSKFSIKNVLKFGAAFFFLSFCTEVFISGSTKKMSRCARFK